LSASSHAHDKSAKDFPGFASNFIQTILYDRQERDIVPFKLLRRGGAVSTSRLLSSKAYQWIFQNIRDGIFLIDAEGMILEANPSGHSMLGYAPTESLSLRLPETIADGACPEFQEKWKALWQEGKVSCETWLRRKGETVFPVEIEAVKLDEGLALATVRDLTDRKRLEEALQASEGKYRSVVEQAGDAILIFDPATEAIQEVNRAAIEWFGYAREEMLSMKITELMAEDPESMRANIERISQRDDLYLMERRARRKDGSLIDVEASASPIIYEGRRHILCILRDVGERKALLQESALHAEREALIGRIGRLINAARDLDTLLRTVVVEIARTLQADRSFIVCLNQPAHEIVIEYEYLDPNLPNKTSLLGRCPLQNMMAALEAQQRHEILWCNRTHTPLPLESISDRLFEQYGIQSLLSVPIHLQDEGYFGALNLAQSRYSRQWTPEEIAVVQSMVDQLAIAIQNTRRYEALMAERDKMTAILSNIGVGVCAMDKDYNIIFMSGKLIQEFGDCVGKKCYDVFDYGDKARCKTCGVKHIIEMGKDQYIYTHSTLEDLQQGFNIGSEVSPLLDEIFEVTCTPIYIRGERCVLEVSRNITAQERWRQTQKMEAVWTLAGGIAHDFNNLLTGILGYTSLMLSAMPPDDPDRKSVEMIAKSAQQAADLTAQLLSFSRHTPVQTVPVNLNDLIADTVPLLRRSIGASIELQVRIEPNIPSVQADPTQLKQILMNLCMNARDAMPDGGALLLETHPVTLTPEECQGYPEARPGSFIRLSVTDTGSGIPSSHLPRIFEPFFTTKEQGKGTGLGLATVYATVKSYGGFIQVTSVPGHTCFDVFLPATDRSPIPAPPPSRKPPVKPPTATMLVVDDEPIVLEYIRDALASLGHNVFTAANGEEAIECYASRHDEIDLVILDLTMPRMGGRECYQHLIRIDPDVRVIFSSGYDVEELPQNLIDTGVVGFLQKPYEVATLNEKINEFLMQNPAD